MGPNDHSGPPFRDRAAHSGTEEHAPEPRPLDWAELELAAAERRIAADDAVEHPSHYTRGRFETIDVIEDWGLGFCLGNAVKYISRAGHKDPSRTVEDLKKARWYLERHIAQLEAKAAK